jgi:hypothetical protein
MKWLNEKDAEYKSKFIEEFKQDWYEISCMADNFLTAIKQ